MSSLLKSLRTPLSTLVLAFALTSMSPLEASAQSDLLGPIREQVLYANYPEAIANANTLLARTDLSAETRNGALELLATAQLANRETAAANQTLQRLYARDPGHRLSDPDASPPVISAFARAREAHPAPVIVGVVHQPPTLIRRESPSIEASLTTNADAVDEVRLVYRQGAEGWSRVVMNRRPDGTYAARIPVIGAADQAIDVVYYIVATAPSDTELAHRGTEGDPLALRIPADTQVARMMPQDQIPIPTTPAPQGGGSVAEEWWFWTLIGAVVAGGVVTGVVLGTQDNGIPQGTLGTVTLMR